MFQAPDLNKIYIFNMHANFTKLPENIPSKARIFLRQIYFYLFLILFSLYKKYATVLHSIWVLINMSMDFVLPSTVEQFWLERQFNHTHAGRCFIRTANHSERDVVLCRHLLDY